MKPLYFPFTYIPKSVCSALSACFPQTMVYQISDTKIPKNMQEQSRIGILDIRIPVKVNGEFFDKVLKDYRAWVDLHQGTETAFLAAMANKIPFFDESASSQIRADLKKIGKQAPVEEKPDPMFNAKLFLHMAQEFDLQMEELSLDLMDIESMEDDFMKNLKWEDDDDHARAVARRVSENDDPGQFMTTERLNAWISLMFQGPQDSGLFITTSRAVLEHLMDIVPEMEQVIRFDDVPMGVSKNETLSHWQDHLMKTLDMLATENFPVPLDGMTNPPEITGEDSSVALTIYIVPNKTPHECFAHCTDANASPSEPGKTDTRFKNTLIGLVEKTR